MTFLADSGRPVSTARRLTATERRHQLLEVAIAIVRDDGADRLTLGNLATRAGVSKPVAYDHFGTRSNLLVELIRWIDTERVNAFLTAIRGVERTADEAVNTLAAAYIDCAADTQGEFFAIGAALAGSDEKAAVYQELVDNYVDMFVEVLIAHSVFDRRDLGRRCIGLVGAGEAVSSALIRGQIDRLTAVTTFAALISGALDER